MHEDNEGLDLIEADIARQASVLGRSVPALRAASSEIMGELPRSRSRVYLIGCGDSLDAGIATRYLWERLSGVPVEAVPAMTFATSVVDLAPPGSLVVALSQSGKVSRVVEGIRAARARGLATATITANPTSALAIEPSDATWLLDFDKLGSIPGTTSHLLGLIALYELACASAHDRGARDDVRAQLDRLPDLVDRAVVSCTPIAAEHARSITRQTPILTIGYGAGLSSARFTVRKLLELTQLTALWQETEEYAHDEYSLVDRRFRVMQFAPPDRGTVRSREIAGYLRRLDVHLGVVTDGDEAAAYRDVSDLVYALPGCPAVLVPLLYAVPGQVLSLATAREVGGSLYGMSERIHREDGDAQIYESEIAS